MHPCLRYLTCTFPHGAGADMFYKHFVNTTPRYCPLYHTSQRNMHRSWVCYSRPCRFLKLLRYIALFAILAISWKPGLLLVNCVDRGLYLLYDMHAFISGLQFYCGRFHMRFCINGSLYRSVLRNMKHSLPHHLLITVIMFLCLDNYIASMSRVRFVGKSCVMSQLLHLLIGLAFLEMYGYRH